MWHINIHNHNHNIVFLFEKNNKTNGNKLMEEASYVHMTICFIQ